MRIHATTILALIGLTACGGGGSTSAIPAGNQAASRPPQSATVTFRIVVPSKTGASGRRSPRYVSAATQSATLSVSPAGGSVAATATVNCTNVCSGQIAAPVGSDTFTAKLYDAQNGTGNLLSTGATTQTIVVDQANAVNLTFNGVVARLSVAFTSPTLTYGIAGSTTVAVNALDADGNVIVGPGVYVDGSGNPVTITLSDSDTSGSTHLGQTTLTQPGAPVTFTYNGAMLASATVTAAAGALNSAQSAVAFVCGPPSSTPALYVGTGSPAGSGWQTYPLTSSGSATPATTTLDTSNTLAYSSLTVDTQGVVYAPILATPTAPVGISIAEYCPQASGSDPPPYRSFSVANVESVAVDPSRNVYATTYDVGSGTAQIVQFGPDPGAPVPLHSPQSVTPQRTIAGPSTGLNATSNVAANASTVFAQPRYARKVYAFSTSANGNVAPSATLTAPASSGLFSPGTLVGDGSGNIYVQYGNVIAGVAPAHPTIAVYSSGHYTAPVRTFTVPDAQYFEALALDAAGQLYAIFETSSNTLQMDVYASNASGNATPLAQYTLPIPGSSGSVPFPNQMAIDGAGHVYVADSNGFGVIVYDTTGHLVGQIAPSAGGVGAALGVAIDPTSGNVVVQSEVYPGTSTGLNALEYFPAGTTSTTAPARTISDGSYVDPTNANTVLIDAAGNVYVRTGINAAVPEAVVKYAAGSGSTAAPASAFIDPLDFGDAAADGNGLAFDGAGNLVLSGVDAHTLFAYAPGTNGNAATPIAAYSDFSAGFSINANAMATDASGTLYVVDEGTNAIFVFAPGATTPSRTIAGPHTRIWLSLSIAVDSAGEIFVRTPDAVLVYPAGAAGDVAPSHVLYAAAPQSQVLPASAPKGQGLAIGPGPSTGTGAVTRASLGWTTSGTFDAALTARNVRAARAWMCSRAAQAAPGARITHAPLDRTCAAKAKAGR